MEVVKPLSEHIQLNTSIFRMGSLGAKTEVNFVIGGAGIGDYIGYLCVLDWVAKTHPQVLGRVYCGDFFLPIVENVFRKYPHWASLNRNKLNEHLIKTRPTFATHTEFPNRLGMHSVDLGYVYYANIFPPPEDGNSYPQLDFSEYKTNELPPSYAVMTPYATNKPRMMDAKAFNGIKDHFIRCGITPVFIGKKEITAQRFVELNPGYDFTGGLDLTNQTSLLSAAGIMSEAKVVVGLDNGLLHLAAMTEVPIVFGYTVSSPSHAKPRRKSGKIFNIYPDEKNLPCTFCQSKMRYMFNHDFAECVYRDLLCIDALSDPTDWIGQIAAALNE